MFHLDVNSIFLKGPIEEHTLVSQPPKFVIKGKEYIVYRLSKSLYGSKHTLR